MDGDIMENGEVTEAVEECGELLNGIKENFDAEAEECAPQEVVETLGCMLPQIPLSEAVVGYILHPDYEYNGYVEEGVGKAIKEFGSNLKVSTNIKTLSMKIAITKKRIEIARKKKQFKDKIPELQKELAGYTKELRRLENMANNSEKRDINATKKAANTSVSNNKEIKEAIEEIDYDNETMLMQEASDKAIAAAVVGATAIAVGAITTCAFKDLLLNNSAVKYYAEKHKVTPKFDELTKKVHKIDAYGQTVSDKEVKFNKDRRFNVIEVYKYKDKPFLAVKYTCTANNTGYGISTNGELTFNYNMQKNVSYIAYNKTASEHINYYLYNTLKKHDMSTSNSSYRNWLGKIRTEYKHDKKGDNKDVLSNEETTESVYVDEMGQPVPVNTRIQFLQQYINQKLNPQLAQLKASLNGKTYAPDIKNIKEQIKAKESEINAKKAEINSIKLKAGNVKSPGMPNRANTDPMRGRGTAIAASADEPIEGNEVTEARHMEEEIKPIVDKLNSLGYKVKYASPGHKKLRKKDDNEGDGIYYGALYTDARIMFEEDYKFPSAPKGWKWRTVDKKDYLDVIPKKCKAEDGTEAFDKWKSEYMDSLKKWAFALPSKSSSPVTKANDNTNEDRKKKSEAPNIIKHESVEFNRGKIRMMGDIFKENQKNIPVHEELVEEEVEDDIYIEGSGFESNIDIERFVNNFMNR